MVTTHAPATPGVERARRPRRGTEAVRDAAAEAVTQVREPRRLRRLVAFGPRCPDCAARTRRGLLALPRLRLLGLRFRPPGAIGACGQTPFARFRA